MQTTFSSPASQLLMACAILLTMSLDDSKRLRHVSRKRDIQAFGRPARRRAPPFRSASKASAALPRQRSSRNACREPGLWRCGWAARHWKRMATVDSDRASGRQCAALDARSIVDAGSAIEVLHVRDQGSVDALWLFRPSDVTGFAVCSR